MESKSRRQLVRTAVLNRTIGRWMRVVDVLLDRHLDTGAPPEVEAEHVAKLALVLMVGDLLTEEDAVLLLDSNKLKLPKSLEDSSIEDIRDLLDGVDDDAPPGDDGPGGRVLSPDDGG